MKKMKELVKSKVIDLNKIFGIKKIEKWLKDYPIFKIECVKKWIIDKIDKFTDEGKDAVKFAIASYLKPLYQYCLYNKVNNPNELLNEEIDQRNLRLKVYLKDFLMNPNGKLEDYKKIGFRTQPSEVSIRNNIQSRIKSFFSNRGKPISYNMKSKKSGANIRELTLTKDIIKKIQSKLESPNYRLICKSESQLGLRISDVLEELTNGKYIIEKFKDHYFVRNFETQKRKVIINYMFFTRELENTLKAITGLDDLTKCDLTKLLLTRNETRIKQNDYLQRLKEIVKELGIKGNIKTHAFRKYYIGAIGKCANRLEDPRIITHFEGHEASYTDQSYLRMIKDIETYYNEWLKTEICVCIDCIAIDKTDKEVLALKENNIKLEQRLEKVLKEKIAFETNIKEEINNLKENTKSKSEEKTIINFSKKLLTAIENFGNSETKYDELGDYTEDQRSKDYTEDIYINAIVEKLIDTVKKGITNQ